MHEPANQKVKKHPWLAYLFGLLFASVGLVFLVFSIIPSFSQWVDMKSWQPVPAQLLSARLKTYSGDGTTYEAIARYQYQWNGVTYQSSRVGISSGADNIGDWQQSKARHLAASLKQGRSVTALVNPDNPYEAVIFREMRWGLFAFKMIFVVVFSAVGFGVILWAWHSRGKNTMEASQSETPWQDNEDWANPVVCDSKSQFYASLFFALIWNAISMPLLFVLPGEISKGNHAAALGLLFPLVGAGMIVWCFNSYRRWLKFGKLALVMDPWPGNIGGQVGGYIQLPVASEALANITLSCIHSYYSGSGKNRERRESVKWQKSGIAELACSPHGSELRFNFDVPEGIPASELPDNSYHFWRLNAKAELPGADLDCNFEIPVFPGTAQSEMVLDCASQHPQLNEERYLQLEQLINAKSLPGGVELKFKIFRNPGVNLGGMAFGSIFIGSGVFVEKVAGPFFMAIIFIGIGSLMAFGFGYRFLNSYRVKIGEKGLYTERYLLGMLIKKRFFPPDDIRLLQLASKGTSTIGDKHTEHFQINALLANGQNVSVVESLNGRAQAEEALEMLSLMSGYEADS